MLIIHTHIISKFCSSLKNMIIKISKTNEINHRKIVKLKEEKKEMDIIHLKIYESKYYFIEILQILFLKGKI